MLFGHENKIQSLEYTMLYPAEGDSPILEVSGNNINEFLHVSLNVRGSLEFTFFLKKTFTLSQSQISEISKIAKMRLHFSDYPKE